MKPQDGSPLKPIQAATPPPRALRLSRLRGRNLSPQSLVLLLVRSFSVRCRQERVKSLFIANSERRHREIGGAQSLALPRYTTRTKAAAAELGFGR